MITEVVLQDDNAEQSLGIFQDEEEARAVALAYGTELENNGVEIEISEVDV